MKIIKINESQFNRIFEDIEDWGKNSIPDYQTQDEMSLTSKIHDKDGDIKDSNPKTTQDKQDTMTQQGWWGQRTNRNSTNTI